MTAVNKSASKVLKVLKALRGHSLKGATNQELANQLNESPSTITRALQVLSEEGLVQKLDDGSYALGSFLVSIAHSHAQEIERAQSRISEHLQRVFAGVHQIKSEA
ncbi:helix-turn-helix domain-containing protein [Acinetobacter baumannii]|uniref:helix-turn-helix domain-containing protein n=1 Tax=Acinetobacter baumannii TaxID=470 RepID=UPI0001F8ADFF|nr:helix-turn-helix domain-containing protein [Acinetobacter baumannii]ADX03003.1 Putative phage-related DNA-binding rotein [Acinetobacter baumannii 1656-2]AOP63356.1 IclR helix-turn-helix domain protein [Acinetobacter baumannii DU202]RQL52006.1 IclR family transcriptional regulator [Acinetobacter baumannii]RSP41881.1 ArsR family transcriptional regulator [Acinetobacter baumannii]